MRLIDAGAAVDALCKSECGWNNAECRHKDGTDFCVTCDNVKIIKSLPSVQLNHNAEVSKMGIVHCEDCEHWDTSWETVYGLHYCPMIDMSTKKNFFCKYGAEKRGEIDETD